jgi:hypothetical protein
LFRERIRQVSAIAINELGYISKNMATFSAISKKPTMDIQEQIEQFIIGQPQPKRSEMQALHKLIINILPKGKLWFDDGKSNPNQADINPTIGYGARTIKYANGTTREFFQTGMSANKTGISIYILGIADKTYLKDTYAKDLGKASVTGYCIRFKKLEDINQNILEAAIRYGAKVTNEN